MHYPSGSHSLRHPEARYVDSLNRSADLPRDHYQGRPPDSGEPITLREVQNVTPFALPAASRKTVRTGWLSVRGTESDERTEHAPGYSCGAADCRLVRTGS